MDGALSQGAVATPVGWLRVRGGDAGLVEIAFVDDEPPARSGAGDVDVEAAIAALSAYVAGSREPLSLRRAPVGTAFQQAVWAATSAIGFGETRSYGALAVALGKPGASRAVGLANGANPWAVLVPCHRVVGASGALTGYAGGLDRKRWLLAHERGARSLF